VVTWSHKFDDRLNMATEAYYTYQRDVPAVGGPPPIEPNTKGLEDRLHHPAQRVFRRRGDSGPEPRRATLLTASAGATGSNLWGENSALFHHEIRYEHAYDAPAYDLGTRRSQLMLAADLILLY